MTAADLLACGFRGRAGAMQPSDVAAAAARYRCKPAALEALLDVESSGHGFDATGRPKMLPERHIFFRRTAGTPAQAAAVAAKLAYPAQGTLPYPVGPEACYAMLAQMMALAPAAALESCSWGIAQVMGMNFAVGGFADAAAMVTACLDSEANQFALMLGYLEKNNLVGALQREDFAAVSIGYNGKAAAPTYAAKLKTAFLHHDTPSPATPPSKLVAPSLSRPPLYPDQLSSPAWLSVRGGTADDLNAAELAYIRGRNGTATADDLNAAELAAVRSRDGVVRPNSPPPIPGGIA